MLERKKIECRKLFTYPAFSIHLSIGSHSLHPYAQTKPLQFLLKPHQVIRLLVLNIWRQCQLSLIFPLSGTQLQSGELP